MHGVGVYRSILVHDWPPRQVCEPNKTKKEPRGGGGVEPRNTPCVRTYFVQMCSSGSDVHGNKLEAETFPGFNNTKLQIKSPFLKCAGSITIQPFTPIIVKLWYESHCIIVAFFLLGCHLYFNGGGGVFSFWTCVWLLYMLCVYINKTYNNKIPGFWVYVLIIIDKCYEKWYD